ncbi:hypothetical protein PanWU01x14_160280, partial [Parasponia andersonii]
GTGLSDHRAGRSPRGHMSGPTPVRLAHEVPPAQSREWANTREASARGATRAATGAGQHLVAPTQPMRGVATRVAIVRVSPSQQHGRRARLSACAAS